MMIPELKIDPKLQELLDKARSHVMTPKERYEQQVSWVRSMSGKLAEPMRSREEVVKSLADAGVYDPEPSAYSGDNGG